MNIIKKLLIYFLLFFVAFQFIVTPVHAEAAIYGYTYNLTGASDFAQALDTDVDSNGNVYTTGDFYGSNVDLNPTSGSNLVSQSSGFGGGYLTKIKPDGTYDFSYVWDGALGYVIKVDNSDNLYIGLRLRDANVDMDPTAGVDLKSTAGNRDVVIVKIDSNGVYRGSLHWGGTNSDGVDSIALDSNQNIYVVGFYNGTNIDMDPTSGTNLKTSSGQDGYLTKINSDLTYGYTYTVGGSGTDTIEEVALDSQNNLFYTVRFASSNMDVDPTAGTTLKSSAGSNDIVLVKVDSTGAFSYAYTYGSTGSEDASGLVISSQDDIYLAGSFIGTVDFDPTAGTDNKTDNGGARASYITKINANATYGYTTIVQSSSFTDKITLDNNDNLYWIGGFQGSNVDFNPSSGTDLKSSNGDFDIFISKYLSDGTYAYTYSLGGTSYDDAYGNVAVYDNKLYFSGYSESTTFDGDPTSGVNIITTNGNGQSLLFHLILDYLAPTVTLSSSISNSSDTTPTINGTAADPSGLGTVTTVQFQVDGTSGTWTSCTADDGTFDEASEPFTCSVPTSLTEGTHTIYFRATDSNSNTTSTSFTSNGFKIDTTTPSSLTNVSSNGQTYEKRFQPLNIADLSSVGDNDHPQFCFSKAYDTEGGSGISSYTVRVDGRDYLSGIPYTAPNVGGDVRQDGEYGIIKETDEYWYRYSNDNRVSESQEICVYGKGDTKRLYPGLHTWSVRTQDNAGNSIETESRRFLVKANFGSYSSFGAGWGDQANNDYKPGFSQGEWFPVSVLKIGNRSFVNELSTLNPTIFNSEKPFTINTPNPTFFGIANSGSKVMLTIVKEYFDEGTQQRKREQVTKQETTANESSQWGINLTKDITILLNNTSEEKPLYFVTVTVEKENKLAILYDIPVSLSTVYSSQPVLGVADKKTTKTVKKKAQLQKETTIAKKPMDSEPTQSFLSSLMNYFSE